MVSWNDGETSDESLSPLSEEHYCEPYYPATIVDMDWSGTVEIGNILCIHEHPPERMVAFEGQNTVVVLWIGWIQNGLMH